MTPVPVNEFRAVLRMVAEGRFAGPDPDAVISELSKYEQAALVSAVEDGCATDDLAALTDAGRCVLKILGGEVPR